MNLNDTALFERIDTSEMLAYIDALPDQFEQAWAAGRAHNLPPDLGEVRQVVIVGMGGSAISGSLAAGLAEDTAAVPIISIRGYDLPAYATGEHTLVVAMSHSGTTEETLSCMQQAIDRSTKLLAVTTGGELGPMVEAASGGVISYAYDSPPRAALGWLYGGLLAGLSTVGLLPDLSGAVAEAVSRMRSAYESLKADVPDDQNRAKRLAGQLVDRTPIIWAAGLLAPVARRWKTQINENAKSVAYFETLPELNHNSVVGVEFPQNVVIGKIAPIQLRSRRYDHPRVAVRHRETQKLLLGYGIVSDSLKAHGDSRLAQQMTLIQLGDYASYYLAMCYEVDPTPIDSIAMLKQALANT